MNKEKNIVKQSERNIPMLHRVHILTLMLKIITEV